MIGDNDIQISKVTPPTMISYIVILKIEIVKKFTYNYVNKNIYILYKFNYNDVVDKYTNLVD